MKKYGIIFFIGFILCIPAANWMIGNVGTTCVPNGPCLIPVFPGVMAPSGVLLIGLALVLRDFVQRMMGRIFALIAIVVGAVLSIVISPVDLAVASGTAFLLSELADFAVYTPLEKRRLIFAVVASGIVGATVDTALFLWLAFGSFDFFVGQFVGKVFMSVAAIPIIYSSQIIYSRKSKGLIQS